MQTLGLLNSEKKKDSLKHHEYVEAESNQSSELSVWVSILSLIACLCV